MSDRISFEDGEGYERGMAGWSRVAGGMMLDWLAAPPGLRWVDVGCGNGAFTELIVQRCAPAEVQGVDPSESQLGFARTRPGAQGAVFTKGDAQALPFEDGGFDAAVMALVLFFVPDPGRGVAEMVRVVRPGGLVAAYLWEFETGGFPFAPLMAEYRELGMTPAEPPSVEASRPDVLRRLWTEAGLREVELRTFPVERRFDDFESYWAGATATGRSKATVANWPAEKVAAVKERVRARLRDEGGGAVSFTARAVAIRGLRP